MLRLRQLCLVAAELQPVVDALCAAFELDVIHRDPAVERFGLHNALLRVGTSFIEVVAPLREGTAAGRHLQRRGGDGGYMVILDCGDLAPWRAHAEALGVRIAAWLEAPGYTGMQLHPSDTGGALLEINCSDGGNDLLGAYAPAGPDWQRSPRSAQALAITAAALQCADPQRLAARWSAILRRPAGPAGDAFAITLDNAAALRFEPDRDRRGDGLSRIDLAVADPRRAVAAARSVGVTVESVGDTMALLSIGGVRWQVTVAAGVEQS